MYKNYNSCLRGHKIKKKIIFNTFMAVSIKNTFAVFYKQSFLFFSRY